MASFLDAQDIVRVCEKQQSQLIFCYHIFINQKWIWSDIIFKYTFIYHVILLINQYFTQQHFYLEPTMNVCLTHMLTTSYPIY